MKRHLISRYALLAAIAAGLVALAVAATFVRREWQAARALRNIPAPVAKSIQQQSLEFSFSKVSGQQTIFTVHAARATEYTGKKRRLLEDVEIVVHGNRGERNDRIRTQSCDYQPETESIVCEGAVQLDLENADGSNAGGPMRPTGIHIEARQLGFDGATGEASTQAPVNFRFPQGQGSAVGVTYYSREPELKLGKEVRLTLVPERPGEPQTAIRANGLDYDRQTGELVLHGPVRIEKGDRTLEAAQLTVDLDSKWEPRRAWASGPTRMTGGGEGRQASAQAGSVELLFDGHGRVERLNGVGGVRVQEAGADAITLAAKQVAVAISPADMSPRQAWASGDVQLNSRRGAQQSRIETQALQLELAPSGGRTGKKTAAVELRTATSPGPASVVWQSQGEKLRLRAGRLASVFAAGDQIQGLDGAGGVQIERRVGGSPPLVSSADHLHMAFSGGQWSDAEEDGHVRAVQGERQASAEKARMMRAKGTVELTRQARVSDPTMQTTARAIDWNQTTGDLKAHGNVKSSYLGNGQSDSDAGPSAGPANVVADTLSGNTVAGDAIYSGHARLWQGDLVIQADRITLQRARGTLVAEGDVEAAFPETEAVKRSGSSQVLVKGDASSGRGALWRVRAEKLTYQSEGGSGKDATSGRVTLWGGAQAISDQRQMAAQILVLLLSRDHSGRAQLERATGEGGVRIRDGKRWGSAPRGDYSARDGRFVLSGGNATLRDTSGDVVSGSRLTFYVADDTIQVESSEGTRTLTLHPVPK